MKQMLSTTARCVAIIIILISLFHPPTVAYSSAPPDDVIELAKVYLRDHATEYSLKPDLSDLKFLRVASGLEADNVHFQQTYKGILVYGRYISVSVSRQQARTPHITSLYDPFVQVPSTTPRIGVNDALSKATTVIGATEPPKEPKYSELVIYPLKLAGKKTQYVLAWEVSFSTTDPIGSWDSFVDASTGELLDTFNRIIRDAPNEMTIRSGPSASNTLATSEQAEVRGEPVQKSTPTPGPSIFATPNLIQQLAAGTTTRVSVATNGTQGNNLSDTPRISANGRYVVFESHANNLVSGDTNGTDDIFIRDLQGGATTRVSVATNGAQGNGGVDRPAISADGRYVVFRSAATNLVSGDTNGIDDIFVRDRQTGTTTRVSVATNGAQGNDYPDEPAISGDGRYVVFESWANNLVSGDTNGQPDIFVRDLQAGTTTRVSVATNGAQANEGSYWSTISGDGRYVAFVSYANNLVSGDTNGAADVFVRDRQTGTTTRVSVATNGAQGNDFSERTSISADGRYIVFRSASNNLVSGDTNGIDDIFVRDRQIGTTTRVSIATNGAQGNDFSDRPTISSDGRYVVFESWATNLVSGDTNGQQDVFVRDQQTGQTSRISVATAGTEGNGGSYWSTVSADGRYVAFASGASNLVSGDTNGVYDVFLHDRGTTSNLPDLIPNPAPSCPDPVIVSSIQGTCTNGPLYVGETSYFDWGHKNIGASTAGQHYVDLMIDTMVFAHYPFDSLSPDDYSYFYDWAETWSAPGWHTVKLVVDPQNTVAESNEDNNIWEHSFYWSSPSGWVFDPNPVVTSQNTSLRDNNDQDSNILTNERVQVTLQGLDGSGYLRGDYVELKSKDGGPGQAMEPTLTFNYTRSDPRFEEVMIYYHVDKIQRYIQGLGFNNIYNAPITAYAHYTDCRDAYFQGYVDGTGELVFGDGRHWLISPTDCNLTLGAQDVDLAEDADVIAHEYGHAIQNNQVPGWGQQYEGDAMGEGFGDYWAASVYASANGGWNREVIANWAFVSEGGLRTVTSTKHYPEDMDNTDPLDPHEDGEIWSASLWRILETLGRDTADRLILDSHFGLTQQARFGEGVDSILLSDQDINGGVNVSTIARIFRERGILDNLELDNGYYLAILITPNGASQRHNLHSVNDEDWAKFEASAGYQYSIRTANLESNADTVLELYDTNGRTLITSNDDCAYPDPDSCILWTSTRTGTYFLRVRPLNSNKTGRDTGYDLLVSITATPPPNTDIYVGGIKRAGYYIPPHGSLRTSLAGVNSGPIKIINTDNPPKKMIAAERVIYKVNGVNTSFTEMMGLPNGQVDKTYWLPWYNNVDLDTQLRFANVSGSTATVRLYIGGQERTSGCMPSNSPITLSAGQSLRVSCAGVNAGPVQIVSTQNIVAAERVIYKVSGLNTSFTEMMALPNRQLSTTYWLPWYNNVDLDTQLRFANVTNQQTTVRLFIGGQEKTSGCAPSNSPYTLAAGTSLRVSCAGVKNGPVKIVGTQNIVAAERVILKANGTPTSFSEMMASPNSQLNTVFWLPWYNNVTLRTQLWIGNAGSSTATVRVYIGGQEMAGSPFSLVPNTSITKSYAGIDNGPVQIVSNQSIVVSESVIYRVNNVPVSFSEMTGLANHLLNTTYWFPWYNNVDLDSQLRFGVP